MSERCVTHIIVAEDDAASRALLVRQLTKAGYEVTACVNGREALAAIRARVSCIVVADWSMPEMDGLELCRTVRSLAEMQALSFVYFILLTAHSETEEIVAGLEAGADDYLTKPYQKQELLARLRAGERIHALQTELMHRQIELHKANAELAGLNIKLENLANTDVLTGLANRRQLFERFAEEWALSERTGRPLACIMLDIDNFKTTNDTYGHVAGDQVLRKIAETTGGCLRKYDLIGRIGGEEFCVICPDTPVEAVACLAERIRAAVDEMQCVLDGNRIQVAISLGVAARDLTHEKLDDLMAAADEALYRAKQGGRNQTWVGDADGQPRPVSPSPVHPGSSNDHTVSL
jgi:diguanylate cyclase (GGDEF)-like protein